MATNNQRAISWPSQHSSQMQSAVPISIIANPFTPAPCICFPTRFPPSLNPALGRASSLFFGLQSEGRRSFSYRGFQPLPTKTKQGLSTLDCWTKTHEGIFICVRLLGRREGLVTCKKTHWEEKAATGEVGVTLFIGRRLGPVPHALRQPGERAQWPWAR